MMGERRDGPTPHGGAYAVLYRDPAGAPREIVEYAADGTEIMRTYARPPAAASEEDDGTAET
jgi:hypothetical protein